MIKQMFPANHNLFVDKLIVKCSRAQTRFATFQHFSSVPTSTSSKYPPSTLAIDLSQELIGSTCPILRMTWMWMLRRRMTRWCSARTIPTKESEVPPIYRLKLRIVYHGKRLPSLYSLDSVNRFRRVEKYRPDTLEDVCGHQDILATINKFVDTNVCPMTFPNSKQRWI